eukprot:CAMPEP_0185783670 /NCGR_PEP_ID=MMETSP1174-20130828/118383_1 /TAXON_ID=35687 /ORGANISM="Dictyocha speculum, Strain CCMP1381" /LENGTH=56 /DNA_ID=CAMNT_0028474845 /DNA_START=34 /DNA_END=201 /DNA_ORIENTATION=-
MESIRDSNVDDIRKKDNANAAGAVLSPFRLFLDTAVEDEWAEHLDAGFFYGVTTNP